MIRSELIQKIAEENPHLFQRDVERTKGTIRTMDGRWVYLGSTFVQGEAPRPYGDFPADFDTQAGETLPDVGVLEVTGEGRARLLLPLPYRESVLNVLVLTR